MSNQREPVEIQDLSPPSEDRPSSATSTSSSGNSYGSTSSAVVSSSASESRSRKRKLSKSKHEGPALTNSGILRCGLTAFTKSRGVKPVRKWINQPNQALDNVDVSNQFTMCTYNVLCQQTTLSTKYLYGHLKTKAHQMEWEYRSKRMESELVELGADIYGMQEVQEDHYSTFFEPLFRKHGYTGYFKKKYGNDLKYDGCAVFYRTEKFVEVGEGYRGVQYFVKLGTALDREQVGQILPLQFVSTGQIVVIANTHLIFNEGRGDVKLAQLTMLFANIDEVISKLDVSDVPLILVGDMNVEPHSPIYGFITNGRLRVNGLPTKELSGQGKTGGPICMVQQLLPEDSRLCQDSRFVERSQTNSHETGVLTHPFKLNSVYTHGSNRGYKREISTYHKDAANPDFIFYGTQGAPSGTFGHSRLELLASYSLPTFEQLSKWTPWPNAFVPSDHIPLIARFRLNTHEQGTF